MTNTFWRPSDEQRRTILLMEALGLIHDLGKMSDRLLQKQDPSLNVEYGYNLLSDPRNIDIYYNFQNITCDPSAEFVTQILDTANNQPCAFGEITGINDPLKEIEFTWDSEQYNFAELMPILTKPKLSVDQNANWNGVLGKSMKPGLLIAYLHGIAHIDKEGDPEKHKQPYSSVFRATPFGHEEQVGTQGVQELTKTLNKLPLNDITKIATSQRSEWLEQMKLLMQRGLADNRRPHNEISLWDWGYSVATFAKAATNYIFKSGWPSNIRKLPFCTLRINLNILECYTHNDKISDLLGIKQVIDDAFKKVKTLLEENYALGNQLYRDETGSYYLLPNIFDNNEQIELKQEIQSLFPPDLKPKIYFSNSFTADALHHFKSGSDNSNTDSKNAAKGDVNKLVAEPRLEARKEKKTTNNNFYLFETEWKDNRPENSETCTVCGVRPVGYPLQGSCPEVEITLSQWAKQKKAQDRKICRVCLDRRGRRSEQWLKNIGQEHQRNTIWTDEVADNNGRLALFVGKLGLEGWLDGTLLSTIQVTDNITKNPSPARLYRIAETARAFWQKVTDELMPNTVGLRSFRLELSPDVDDFPDLGDYQAYDLDIDGVVLSVVWDKPNKRFLITDNLNYCSTQLGITEADIIEKLQGKTFQLSEPSSFLQSSRPKTKVNVQTVKQINGYYPCISLLSEPTVSLILVPGNKALELGLTHCTNSL